MKPGKSDIMELYDLSEDMFETTDISKVDSHQQVHQSCFAKAAVHLSWRPCFDVHDLHLLMLLAAF